MALKTKQISELKPEFEFASFTWPKYAARLGKGKLGERLAERKNLCCGEYQLNPMLDGKTDREYSFYLDSDFMVGKRWKWADEIDGRIGHTGWWTDEYRDGEKIRGIVIQLSGGRFLAGWSMGEGWASGVKREVLEDEMEAANFADSLAEQVAEREREFRMNEREEEKE